MRNRDNQQGAKRAERQTRDAGKRPFHRVPKLQKLFERIVLRKKLNRQGGGESFKHK